MVETGFPNDWECLSRCTVVNPCPAEPVYTLPLQTI